MAIFGLFKNRRAALLSVKIDGVEVCTVEDSDLPCELKPSAKVQAGSVVAFFASDGTAHRHALGESRGWAHFSIRVHANKGCQADCAIADSPQFDPGDFARGAATGIRFQPFFLPGSSISPSSLKGNGLFARGLHFTGQITPGFILLSCECDVCHRSFLIRSFHAGFSHVGYFYSDSGKYTLIVSANLDGAPTVLADSDPVAVTMLEARLPSAPDGSRFNFLNPFRCPHCRAPYIDFVAHPGLRSVEYYGNYFPDIELMRYPPA